MAALKLPAAIVDRARTMLVALGRTGPARRGRGTHGQEAADLAAAVTMRILTLAPVGVLVAELREGEPLTYVNPVFEEITGYAPADALGKNCRYLQRSNRLQPQITQMREEIRRHDDVSVTQRNYRKDGGLFWNALCLAPATASGGEPTHTSGCRT